MSDNKIINNNKETKNTYAMENNNNNLKNKKT